MSARAAATIWRNGGARGLVRTASAAIRMEAPLLLGGRRTAASVGAYYDLVTDISRRLYGDNFHFGYFPTGAETLTEAHDAHTDLVAELAGLEAGSRVLDIGCGIGAPAMRIVRRYDCDVTGVNISREQVRQGRALIAEQGMSDRVRIERGDARNLPFESASFDAIVCVEVAGDICVNAADKQTLITEMFRVLKPGGGVGFSDLALRHVASRADRRVLRGVFYDDGSNLVTDWPALFEQRGFIVDEHRCILAETMPTWAHVRTLYAGDSSELARCYGRSVARRTGAQIDRLPEILRRLGTFPVIAARKPATATPDGVAVAVARED
jgi:cyclopropane fatty-acyl-phospholipid synthase-like methyltransferase